MNVKDIRMNVKEKESSQMEKDRKKPIVKTKSFNKIV